MKILKYTMTGSSREFYGTGTIFFRYRDRYFFLGSNVSGTGTGTFFRDQIFPVPVPVLFSGTNFFRYRYRYRYHPKRSEIPGTGNSRDRDVTLWCTLRAVCRYFLLVLSMAMRYLPNLENINVLYSSVFSLELWHKRNKIKLS